MKSLCSSKKKRNVRRETEVIVGLDSHKERRHRLSRRTATMAAPNRSSKVFCHACDVHQTMMTGTHPASVDGVVVGGIPSGVGTYSAVLPVLLPRHLDRVRLTCEQKRSDLACSGFCLLLSSSETPKNGSTARDRISTNARRLK